MMRLTIFTFFVGAALAKPSLDGRIVGGSDAATGQFPHIISLRTSSNSHTCGGSLIDTQWVLTAGHCVAGGRPASYSVIAGINQLDSRNGVQVGLSQIIVHPRYDDYELTNDLALLKLATPIQEAANIKIIQLETSLDDTPRDLVLSGWGRTSYPGTIPNNLQYLPLRSVTISLCRQSWPYETILDSQICTFTRSGEGACHGDSGGPLQDATTGKQVGIVSWGAPCAVGAPDVFTRVSAFIDWIEENTGLTLS